MSKKKLKKILKKIENIINEAHKILKPLNVPSNNNVDKRQTVAANPHGAVTTAAPPPVVIGRDEDRDKIIAMLHGTVGDGQPESNSALSYSIIGIHGIPGSGKSTLAQYVYAREKKDKHFDLVMWIHVSQNFSVHTIFREMLEEATGNPSPEFHSLNTLEQKVEEALSGKRFLVVLDDVWYNRDVSHQELQQMISPLKVGEPGSRILVTSRTSDALLALGAVRCIRISDLDDNAFLKLFMHYALEGARIDDQNRRIFEMIGADIAKKLNRSPLAARTVGGQLCIRPNVEFWRSVQDRDLLNETRGALWWSYHHLDEQVRRCFAYCSIFPRRHRLERDKLVNFWVAEGFIKTTEIGEEMEGIAQDYFDELVSTSFLQLGGKNFLGRDYYTIHDLLHDLAEKVAGSDCFRIENAWTGEVPRDVRHLFVETRNRALITDKIFKLENLRTLIMEEQIEEEDFGSMFTSLRKLRILSVQVILRRSGQFSVPASIGQLKHIRYLAIKTGPFLELILPSTFSKLYHMQVLEFDECQLVFCPGQGMSNLINLRHILTSPRNLHLPNIIGLTSLQTLPAFEVRTEYELWQLRDLNKLRGRLQIRGLENVGSKEEALEANLASKERITKLYLAWGWHRLHGSLVAEILEGLRPPMHLEKLVIQGYRGSSYPDWMVGNTNGPNHLQLLVIRDCSRLGAIPDRNEFFLHLRRLTLSDCTWNALPDNMENLTSLKTLFISCCKNIRSLPSLPHSLEEFKLKDCNDVFMRSCQNRRHRNWAKIKHVPKKDIGWLSSRSPNKSNGLEEDLPMLFKGRSYWLLLIAFSCGLLFWLLTSRRMEGK